jgi:tRNA A37 threonylcarbamoyladenosine modification protein TsaB
LALASGKPAVGLTTLAGFAAPHIAEHDGSPVVTVIDARHENVYLQVFGPGGRTIVPPRVAPIREAIRIATGGAPMRIAGSAANLLVAAWPRTEPAPLVVDQRDAPDIVWVARLGAAAADTQTSPKPLYLRAPDAQPQDAARLPRR